MKRILILESDPQVRVFMKEQVPDGEYTFLAVSTSSDGLAAAGDFCPDLIMANLWNAEHEVYDFQDLVRAYSDIPTVLYVTYENEGETFFDQVSGCITKTMHIMRFKDEIGKYIEAGAHRPSILIVDDDDSFLTLAEQVLKESYDVTTAVSGMDALLKLAENVVDVVITDLEMPDMNGAELITAMKKNDDLRNIPVIIQSSHDWALDKPIWSKLQIESRISKNDFSTWVTSVFNAHC